MASGFDLSSDQDLVIDGECVPRPPQSILKANPDLCYGGPTVKGFPERDRFESGYGDSLIVSSHIESSAVEKVPVQCSDGQSDSLYSSSSKSLEEIDSKVSDSDEGIASLASGFDDMTVSEGSSICQNTETVCDSMCEDDKEVDVFQKDEDGDTLLHLAIIGGTVEVASVLIDMAPTKEVLNIANNLYQTSLHLAVLLKQVQIVKKLLSSGAEVLARDRQGNTALHVACREGSLAPVKIILESSEINSAEKSRLLTIRNCEGLSCLHIAMMQRYFDIAQCLLENGADVNISDSKSGRTVLHYLVERKDLAGVRLLLKHPSINVNAQTYKGETPLLIGYWRNYQDIVKKLKSKGAYFDYDLLEDLDDSDSNS